MSVLTAKVADYIQMLLPDELQARIYSEQIAPNMTEGKVLGFSTASTFASSRIVPRRM